MKLLSKEKILHFITTTICILILNILYIYADESIVSDSTIQDTSSIDTTSTDTLKKKAHIFLPNNMHGSQTILAKPYQAISKKDILYTNYTDFSDILYDQTSAYPLSLGSFGHNNSASFFGGSYASSAFSYNGRSIAEPDYGGYSMTQMPVEFIEKAEIFVGSDAAIFADNANGSYINFQEIYYNSSKPYTRMWYSQAGFDFISADGIFTQNIAPNLNLTAGFRSMTTIGEYENENHDSWNWRIRLRYAIDSLRTISLAENFYSAKNGLYGGNTPNTLAIYDFYAEPLYEDLNQLNTRHDITLSYSSLNGDSSSFFKANTFLTNTHRIFKNNDFYWSEPDSNTSIAFSNLSLGLNTSYDRYFGDLGITVGGDASYYFLDETPYIEEQTLLNSTVYSRLEYNIYHSNEAKENASNKKTSLSMGARYGRYYDKAILNFGGKIQSALGNKTFISLDASISERAPSPNEGLDLLAEKHLLGILQLKNIQESVSYGLEMFYRNIDNSIMGEALSNDEGIIYKVESYNLDVSREIFGASAQLSFDIADKFFTDLNVGFYYSLTADTLDKILPMLTGKIKAYYLIKKVRSDLKLGVSANLLTPFMGQGYSPLQCVNYYVNQKNDEIGIALNVFAAARFSGVFIRIDYQNMLDYGYYYVPYYPQLGRNLRLSVSFPFNK